MSNKQNQQAFTIVELMIAVTIIASVTALALPRVREALRSNVLSSAANTVDGSFEMARATAIRSGRPHGVLIERKRSNLFPLGGSLSPQEGLGKASNLVSANYSTRISFVQMPSDYQLGSNVYPFLTLSNSNNNCTKQLRFFVPRTEAPLLFAAVDTTAPGHPIASRLIGLGSAITIGRDLTDLGRTSEITGLQLISAPSTFASAVNVYSGSGPATCGTPVTAPLASLGSQEGVVITTGDFAIGGATVGTRARSAGDLANFSNAYQPMAGSIQLRPTKAAIAPVNLPGKAAIDLSVSGWRDRPDAFGVQGIVNDGDPDNDPSTNAEGDALVSTAAANAMNGIIIMFSPNGSVESVHLDVFDPSTGLFTWQRFPPPESICLLVGTSDAVLPNFDDLARYLENPSNVADYTSYGTNSGDYAPLLEPAPPQPITPRTIPNVANSDNTWVTINTFSGNVQKTPVAEQLDIDYLERTFGISRANQYPARQIANYRVQSSRRLAFSGAR